MISYLMEPGAIHLVRINTGEDLLDGITEYVTGAGIQAAWLT